MSEPALIDSIGGRLARSASWLVSCAELGVPAMAYGARCPSSPAIGRSRLRCGRVPFAARPPRQKALVSAHRGARSAARRAIASGSARSRWRFSKIRSTGYSATKAATASRTVSGIATASTIACTDSVRPSASAGSAVTAAISYGGSFAGRLQRHPYRGHPRLQISAIVVGVRAVQLDLGRAGVKGHGLAVGRQNRPRRRIGQAREHGHGPPNHIGPARTGLAPLDDNADRDPQQRRNRAHVTETWRRRGIIRRLGTPRPAAQATARPSPDRAMRARVTPTRDCGPQTAAASARISRSPLSARQRRIPSGTSFAKYSLAAPRTRFPASDRSRP